MMRIYSLLGISIHNQQDLQQANAAFKEGVQTILSTAIATIIWAMVTAVAMMAAGMPSFYVILINIVVFAASAQLTVLTMLMVHAPMPVIWLAATMVNLRFVVFSASIKLYFGHMRLLTRLFFGFLNGDIIAMLFHFRYRNEVPSQASSEQSAFFLGMATVNYATWQLGVLVGVLLTSFIPSSWGLDLAAALTMLVLIIKSVEHWAGVVGCLVAATSAVLLQNLPYKLWVLIAIIVGVGAALLVETVLPSAYLKPKKLKEGV